MEKENEKLKRQEVKKPNVHFIRKPAPPLMLAPLNYWHLNNNINDDDIGDDVVDVFNMR